MTAEPSPNWESDSDTARRPGEMRIQEMVRDHFRGVLAICLARVGNRHDAEDLSQEVFIKAFTRLDTLRDSTKQRAWLFAIARRLCVDHHRLPRSPAPLPEDLANSPADVHPQADRLHRALSKLPHDYAEPLVLHYIDGRSCREIAADLGISESAARVRLFRGRMKLRDLMSRDKS